MALAAIFWKLEGVLPELVATPAFLEQYDFARPC
jgi:hypothetical protein